MSDDISICTCIAGLTPHAGCTKSLLQLVHQTLVRLWSLRCIWAGKSCSTGHSSEDTLHLTKSPDCDSSHHCGSILRPFAVHLSMGPSTYVGVLAWLTDWCLRLRAFPLMYCSSWCSCMFNVLCIFEKWWWTAEKERKERTWRCHDGCASQHLISQSSGLPGQCGSSRQCHYKRYTVPGFKLADSECLWVFVQQFWLTCEYWMLMNAQCRPNLVLSQIVKHLF